MSPATYPDFGWFVCAIRTLLMVAAAGLGGAVIGGLSAFAIVSA